ncbi:MAG: hypothetical protein C4345_05730, partial [Chloroflexota bacterium]
HYQPTFTVGEIVAVDTDVLRLRATPGTSSATLALMPFGTRLKVKRSPVLADGFTWYKVNSGIYGTGWCAAQFLRSLTTSASTSFRPGDTVRVVDGSLNLRDGPSLSSRVIAVLPEGTRLTITGDPRVSGGFTWYPVQSAYGTGWCAGDYLRSA